MGLKRIYKKKFKGVYLQSGHFYKFNYQAWEHDPKPTVIFLHSIEGIHPNTGHQWRIIQCLNFTYIPRAMRKRFASEWKSRLESGGNTKIHWQKVQAKYPYLQRGIRRYFFKPSYYITNLEEILPEDIDKEVVKTLTKDFSKKITTALRMKFKKAFDFRKKKKDLKKKAKKAKAEAIRRAKEKAKQAKARARNR